MFFSTLFTLFGLGALCWILFNLAVYALPFAIGLTSGMYLYETGQGVFLSIIAGLFIGGFIAALGEFAFDRIRSVPLKLAIGQIYAVPAGIAGFHAAKGLAEFGGSSGPTITLLSWIGALVVGGTAWARVSGWSEANAISGGPPNNTLENR
ncbi:hypothetical protein [Pararhodobacter zhoushanensis]|uniref:Uncharacterized protein n=1 Tax=Pararhodobacter zhoushanensis TaxID=2479545 RepID=A0ABT3H1P1_9RHOB|nr:hypothetical protein [Pararhodobacter zhoushanensis]MCW1933696.1 hypothetical protein [Pararhodobacter zhoushanensis]